MQAIESDSAVLFVGEILINEVLNKIIITISLISCSNNSLKLIAKNCCWPQSAPLKTSYIAPAINAGRRIRTISVDAFDVNTIFKRFGQRITIPVIIKHKAIVIISPDETIEPMVFLSFFPL